MSMPGAMNGKTRGMSWTQDDVPPEFMPGRSICSDPHSEGVEILEGRFVFGFAVPSKDTPNRVYHCTLDPMTGEIHHECIATQTRYCSRAGMASFGDHTVFRKWPHLCRHAKVVKRWAVRNREALKETVRVLALAYGYEEAG